MASTYRAFNIIGSGGGSDDRRVKVSTDDALPAFLEEKVVAASNKVTVVTTAPGGNELLNIDVDEANIDHDLLLNYDITQHRVTDDASTTTTSLWSSSKIQTELDGKINSATPMTDNKIVKSVGTSGIDVEATGITVDDLDNVTGMNDLTIDGNLTVNGTTTTVNSATLDVTDPNISVNNGGTQAAADASNSGITVTMTDAVDIEIGYDSTTASKMTVGELGSQSEIVTVSHTQTLLNKGLDADNNTVANLEVDNLKTGVLSVDLSLAVDNTKLAGAQAIKDYVTTGLAAQDDALEITYTPTTATDWDVVPAEVESALDESASRINTAEDTLAAHIGAGASKHNATQIANVAAGNIVATDVQAAIDELDTEKYVAANFNGDFDTRLATKDTADVAEGINLYYTETRVSANATVASALQPADPSTSLNHAQATATDWTVATGASVGAHLDEIGGRLNTIENTAPAGDLNEGTFNGAADTAISLDVTGLAFSNASTRSFEAQVSVLVNATSNLYESFDIEGIQKGASWDISVSSIGDDSLITFDITAAGQLTYSKDTTSGWTSTVLKYRAQTTSV